TGLRALADRATRQFEAELSRKHVPDRCAYLVIGPPIERALGVAGALASLRETVGIERHREPDLYGVDAALDDAASVLGASRITTLRLRGPVVRDLLWRCTNPGLPAPGALSTTDDLAAMLPPASWHEQFDYVAIGEVLARSLLIMEPPDVTEPGWLDDLVSLA